MINIKCIICNKEIENPKIDQLCCSSKECRDEFERNMIELWKMENPDKIKDLNKKAYENRKKKNSKDNIVV